MCFLGKITFGSYKLYNETIQCAEVDEVCVANDTMSYEDYLKCRFLDITVEIFYNNGVFREYIKIPRTKEAFIIRFTNNEKKYSFHGIMKKNDQIIGSYPVIPNKFKYFDKEIEEQLGK